MNSRLLVSIALPVTAFVVTVAILLWQQRVEVPTPVAAQPAAPARREQVILPRMQTAKPAEPVAEVTNSAPQPPLAVANVSDPNYAAVPVRLNARGQPDVVATLLNMTAEELDVTVTGVSAKTHMRSVVDVSLHPHERRNLTAAGLELRSGDQVTIQSPPYRDLVVQAR